MIWVTSILVVCTLGEIRTWTDSTGKFSVEAEFAGAAMAQVKLRKASGETISISIDRLSEADRRWLKDRQRRGRRAKKAEPLSPEAVLERLRRQAEKNWHLAACLRSISASGPAPVGMTEAEKKTYREKVGIVVQQGESQRLEMIRQQEENSRATRSPQPRAQARQAIERLGACKGVYLPGLYRLGVGKIGRLYDRNDLAVYGPLREKLEVLQVLGPVDMLVRRGGIELERFWLKGVPTEGVTDGRVIKMEQLMEVTGTTRYETVIGGSNTIFVIEPLKLDPVDFIDASQKAGILPD